MKIEWKIGQRDIESVRTLMSAQGDHWFVKDRQKRNLAKVRPTIVRARFWYSMSSMRMTSQQRSDSDSPVASFIRRRPYPLEYETVRRSNDVKEFIATQLQKSDLKRFAKRIPSELAMNLQLLEDGEWKTALAACAKLTVTATPAIEREVADYIDETFAGFGPKQSRNTLQELGLTRYEIPIDSRIINWLNTKFKFPIRVTPAALADKDYYHFVLDGIHELCDACGVLPCMFDAAVFSLSEKRERPKA